MDVLTELAEADLFDYFDGVTLSRAWDYLDNDRLFYVETTAREADRVEAMCFAHGSGRQTYVVNLALTRFRGRFDVATSCSCPVGLQCKHGAALALAIRPAPQVPVVARTWREEFAELTDAVATLRSGDDAPGVALCFELEAPRWGSRDPRLTVRPLRPGARQKWVRSGLTWGDVPREARGRSYRRTQTAALLRLHHALVASGNHWYLGNQNPSLADFGAGVVGLLRQARDAGVSFVSNGPLPPIEVLDGSASLSVDIVEVGGTARVTVGITHDGRFWSGDALATFGGEPAHTVSVELDDAIGITDLSTPIGGAALVALQRADPILVPAAEVEEFLQMLPGLAGTLSVVSSDGSIEVPERPLPRLRVVVTWHSADRAEVDWSWCYGSLPAFALGTSAPAIVPRDRAAEDRVLAGIHPAPDQAHLELTGADALHLALLQLPLWREAADVEVLESDPPTFRESHATPEFSFEAVDVDDEPEGSRRQDWLDLEVMITVEDRRVPLAHVLEALTLEQPYVVLPGGLYLRTDRPEFDRLAEIVRAAADLHERDDGRIRVSHGDLGVWAELADIGVVDAQASEWVARAQALRDLTEIPRPEPVGVVSTLRNYQLDGFSWLAFLWQHRLGGVLADDMGLGKTLQVLAMIAHTRATEHRPFLVVAPTSVVSAWASEAARHTPGLRIQTVNSTSAKREWPLATLAAEADVVVTSYTLLRLDQSEYGEIDWAGLILDEAQQVKNHNSKVYGAVRMVQAPFRVAVTGTPFENRLMELWSLLSIVAPGLYPRPRSFVENVVHPIEKHGDAGALRRLGTRIKPFVLRRTKELVAADLPPKQEQVLQVELNARHRKIYDTHLNKERQRVLGLVEEDFDRNRVAILAALTRLRQLALDPALVDEAHASVGSAKIDTLVDHLLEIGAEGHRALVFSQFTGFLKRARARLDREGIAYEYLDGTTTRRGEVIERFRNGDAPVFLISLKAGGTGLTLTEADYVFVLDPWWNPAAEAQAVDRSHRIGQNKTVMVYRMVSTETIEDKVMALKARKAKLFAQVIDGEAGLSAQITAADIRGLFD